MIIDHDPNETPRKPERVIYWLGAAIVILLWICEWYFHGFSWRPIALGLFTGAMVTAIAIEITGNKPPSSWGR